MLKPLRGAQLDLTHPHAKGLVACYLMNEGTGTILNDLSKNGNTGTIYNGTWAASEHGGCLSCNGTSTYVNGGNGSTLDFTGALTIETWIKRNVGSGSGYIISKNSIAANDSQYSVYFSSSTNNMNMYLDGSWKCSSSTDSILENELYHIVARYDMTDVRFYVNSQLSGAPQAETSSITSTEYTVNIGRRKPDNIYFDGLIYIVLLYNRAISETEVFNHYKDPYAMFI